MRPSSCGYCGEPWPPGSRPARQLLGLLGPFLSGIEVIRRASSIWNPMVRTGLSEVRVRKMKPIRPPLTLRRSSMSMEEVAAVEDGGARLDNPEASMSGAGTSRHRLARCSRRRRRGTRLGSAKLTPLTMNHPVLRVEPGLQVVDFRTGVVTGEAITRNGLASGVRGYLSPAVIRSRGGRVGLFRPATRTGSRRHSRPRPFLGLACHRVGEHTRSTHPRSGRAGRSCGHSTAHGGAGLRSARCRVLYVSPLKALAHDVGATAKRSGIATAAERLSEPA